MALYLRTKKVDIGAGDEINILVHENDSNRIGVNEGDVVAFRWKDNEVYVEVNVTDSNVLPGEVGIYEEIWQQYQIQNGEYVSIDLIQRPESMEAIKKKILGHKLTEEELNVIMKEVGARKLTEVDVAFFMSTFFNPGFDEDETLWMTKGMANSGVVLSFKDVRGNGAIVVDKHSIGGVAGKAVTPLVVPILAASDLVVPNTSTRAITTPAGTSDILEVAMPVHLTSEQIMDVVKKTGACMVWGGALDLAPADDVIIHAERGIHLESFQKVLVSIVAKKIAMGITHIVIDIPQGKGTKIQNPEDAKMLKEQFISLFKKVGIICEVYSRVAKGPDGNGIGPNMEMRETLKILERKDDRALHLEDIATDMAAVVLEMSGKAATGEGKSLAISKLNSGEALAKFSEIAKAQGASATLKSEDIELGKITWDIVAEKDGIIDIINNRDIVKITRALGCPALKTAGIYVHKMAGDSVKRGDILMTLYATSLERLESAKKAVSIDTLYTYI